MDRHIGSLNAVIKGFITFKTSVVILLYNTE